jgi:hypothetical protein
MSSNTTTNGVTFPGDPKPTGPIPLRQGDQAFARFAPPIAEKPNTVRWFRISVNATERSIAVQGTGFILIADKVETQLPTNPTFQIVRLGEQQQSEIPIALCNLSPIYPSIMVVRGVSFDTLAFRAPFGNTASYTLGVFNDSAANPLQIVYANGAQFTEPSPPP